MVKREGANQHAADFQILARIELTETPPGGDLGKVDRIIWLGHLAFKGLLHIAPGEAGIECYRVLFGIDRRKKRKTLDMVPVEMSQENVGVDRRAVRFLPQLLAQGADAGSRVENEALARWRADFDARCVTAELQILRLWRGRRTANTPKPDTHMLVGHQNAILVRTRF